MAKPPCAPSLMLMAGLFLNTCVPSLSGAQAPTAVVGTCFGKSLRLPGQGQVLSQR